MLPEVVASPLPPKLLLHEAELLRNEDILPVQLSLARRFHTLEDAVGALTLLHDTLAQRGTTEGRAVHSQKVSPVLHL